VRITVLLFGLVACREQPAAPPPVPKPTSPVTTAGTPHARRQPTLAVTAFSWSFAEASNSRPMWTAIADTAQRELDACKANCREIAYEVVLARNHAVRTSDHQPPPMDAPAEPLPPEVEASVAALDAYVASLDAADDEVAPMKFLAAASLWRWRDPSAVVRLESVLRDHRDDATAEYAANQLLDLLMREERIPELRTWVAELSADETFLANKPELRETLAGLTKLLATLPSGRGSSP
jgi:hypothetical protein